MSANLEWLQPYRSFYDADRFENKTAALVPFFELPYWKRIWIRQEVILAKKPLFACGARFLSLETLDSFAAWIRWILTLSPASSHRFLKQEEVSRLNLEYSYYHMILEIIFLARKDIGLPAGLCLKAEPLNLPRNIRGPRPIIWAFSGKANATEPKDHFYGLLGISSVGLVPDYSLDKSVGLVSQEFMAEYVRVSQEESSSSTLAPLGVLMFAGIGHGWHLYADMPSWGPNFPGQARRDRVSKDQADTMAMPDPQGLGSLFKSAADVRVTGSEMTVSALILDSIKDVRLMVSDYGRQELWHQAGLPITWVIDFAMSHANYVAGGHPLAALHFLLSSWRETGTMVHRLIRLSLVSRLSSSWTGFVFKRLLKSRSLRMLKADVSISPKLWLG